MKYIAIVIAFVICGLSFHAGRLHERGELTPTVEAKLKQARDFVLGLMPSRVQGWFGK